MPKYVLILEGKAIQFIESHVDYDEAMINGLDFQGENLTVGFVDETDSTTNEPASYYYAAQNGIEVDEALKFKILLLATS